ncbi:MAG: NlpC/P60 family protein [Armatimonadota bacterium]|nr:NlpC/P60 family protein [Armatimonadota bacterium]
MHVVQPGETVYRIARRYGVTIDALAAVNGLADPTRIRAGQRLRIPPAGGIVPSGGRTHTRSPRRGDTVIPAGAAPSPPAVSRAPAQALQVSAPAVPVEILLGPPSSLPAPGDGVWQPPPGAPTPQDRAVPVHARQIAAAARRLVGVPYTWGGSSAQGVDCSGLVWLLYAPVWPGLPRTSFALFAVGAPVDPAALQPGDLVFFTTYAPGASHVGVYVGDGQFVHVSSSAGRVVSSPLADPYYAARFLGARRLVP